VTDAEFLRALEACELPDGAFDHAGHVRAAYLYLRACGFAGALERMRASIRRYAAHHGSPGKYHETITVAYLALIGQRLLEVGDAPGWEAFRAHNPDLLERDLLLRFYPEAQLHSDLARRTFLLPQGAPTTPRPDA